MKPLLAFLAFASTATAQDVLRSHVSRFDFDARPVAQVGDLDGDGRREYAVLDSSGSFGGVRVYSGASGQLLLSIDGSAAPGPIGMAIAPLHDLDNDGANDLAIADSFARRVRIYSSSTGAQLSATSAPPLSSTYDYFGADLDTVGDWDGDGKRDIVIGAPQCPDVVCGFQGIFPTSSGYAMVVSSRTGATLATLPNRGDLPECSSSAHSRWVREDSSAEECASRPRVLASARRSR